MRKEKKDIYLFSPLFSPEKLEMEMEKYTRFEKAKIIGARALQISMGAPVLIETESNEPIDIAMGEFEMGVIPITVRRRKR